MLAASNNNDASDDTQFHTFYNNKIGTMLLQQGRGFSSRLLFVIGFHYLWLNAVISKRPVYLAWLHLQPLLPENKLGLVLFSSWGILLYLDQVWADDGAAPGIESVYLNTVFYPVFCISCWTRLTRLYRSSGHVKSQAEGKKKIKNTHSCKHTDVWKPLYR